jgi:streptogrisin C
MGRRVAIGRARASKGEALRAPKRREGLVWLAGAAAVATGLALASPALVAGGTAGGAGTDGGSDTLVLSALQRDLSISRGDASTRIARQRWAGSTERMLNDVLGDDFGGAWLGADGKQFTVAVTTKAAAAQVRAAGATPKLVTYAADELAGFKADIDASTRRAGAGIAGWYVDPRTNSVTVLAKPGQSASAKALAADGGVPAGALRVVTSALTPKPLFDIRGGDPYFIDQQFRCSIGFSTRNGFVTAGHCGAVGATTAGFNQAAQGTVRVSTFPGNGDFGFVETNANWTPRPVVNDFNGGEAPVAGSEEAPVGAAVCRSGSTTGTHCGVIQAKNVTVNYPEGAVTGLTQTNVCAEGGDSGGSWLSGDQAQGVTSGGSGDCTVGGTTFFQPIGEILAASGEQLVTSEPGTGQPPATDPPATTPPATEPPAEPAACDGLEAAAEGSLGGTGARQVQPTAGFFNAAQGTHDACLTGPDGADFDVALQQWSGIRWRTVARGAESGAEDTLTFTGRAGFYRYVVTSAQGSGDYRLGVDVP